MPIKGECQSCGNYTFLYGIVADRRDGSGLRYILCCRKCWERYKRGEMF